MVIKIVEEKAFRTLPEVIIDWINEIEMDEKRKSHLRIFANMYLGTINLSFKKPQDKDTKIFGHVVKKAGRYRFGTIYTQQDAARRLSENASETNWVFAVCRCLLSDAESMAHEMEQRFKVNVEIVTINKLPNKDFTPVPDNY